MFSRDLFKFLYLAQLFDIEPMYELSFKKYTW